VVYVIAVIIDVNQLDIREHAIVQNINVVAVIVKQVKILAKKVIDKRC